MRRHMEYAWLVLMLSYRLSFYWKETEALPWSRPWVGSVKPGTWPPHPMSITSAPRGLGLPTAEPRAKGPHHSYLPQGHGQGKEHHARNLEPQVPVLTVSLPPLKPWTGHTLWLDSDPKEKINKLGPTTAPADCLESFQAAAQGRKKLISRGAGIQNQTSVLTSMLIHFPQGSASFGPMAPWKTIGVPIHRFKSYYCHFLATWPQMVRVEGWSCL